MTESLTASRPPHLAEPHRLALCVYVLSLVTALAPWGTNSAHGQGFALGQGNDATAPLPPAADPEAAATDLSAETPEQLVRLLGNDSYAIRQAATLELAGRGVAAKEALLAGLKTDDAEVRLRCRQALSVVLEADYQAQLRAFSNDLDGTQGTSLPGWEAFRDVVGDSAASRHLYVEMQQAEPYLLESVDAPGALIRQALTTRFQELQEEMMAASVAGVRQGFSLGTIATYYFLGSRPDVQFDEPMHSNMSNLSYHNQFQSALQSGPRAPLMRKIIAAWMAQSAGPHFQTLVIAMRYNLAEGVKPALNAVQDAQLPPQVRMYGILLLSKHGNEQHRAVLETLLTDHSICSGGQPGERQAQVQIRDVALTALVKLTEQARSEYHLASVRDTAELGFDPTTVVFPSEEAREEAIARYQKWAAEHPAPQPETDQ